MKTIILTPPTKRPGGNPINKMLIWFDLIVYFDLSFLHEHVLGINTKNFKKSVKRIAVI
jgi:hypothetical protein